MDIIKDCKPPSQLPSSSTHFRILTAPKLEQNPPAGWHRHLIIVSDIKLHYSHLGRALAGDQPRVLCSVYMLYLLSQTEHHGPSFLLSRGTDVKEELARQPRSHFKACDLDDCVPAACCEQPRLTTTAATGGLNLQSWYSWAWFFTEIIQ